MMNSKRATVLVICVMLTGCSTAGKVDRKASGLDSTNADIRRETAIELGTTRVRNRKVRDNLVRRLSVQAQSDADPLTRSAALTAVAVQDGASGVELAKKMRTDPDPMVRWDAVKLLARSRDASAAKVLVEVANAERDENTRREAVKGLGNYKDPEVISTLIERLRDPHLSVAHAARESLIRISGGADMGMSAEAWKKQLQ
jgi:HEAT repeat protein